MAKRSSPESQRTNAENGRRGKAECSRRTGVPQKVEPPTQTTQRIEPTARMIETESARVGTARSNTAIAAEIRGARRAGGEWVVGTHRRGDAPCPGRMLMLQSSTSVKRSQLQ